MTGLVHISQICNQRIAHPSSVLKVGQKVKVKVTAIKDGEATTSLGDLLKKAGF